MYLWHICHIDLELFPFSYLFWDKTDVRSRSRMERFLAIKNKASRNVTALQRQTEFRGWTHVSGEKLFCTPCNLVLDHSRKSSVESHCKSVRHKNALSRQAEEGSDGPSSKRQKQRCRFLYWQKFQVQKSRDTENLLVQRLGVSHSTFQCFGTAYTQMFLSLLRVLWSTLTLAWTRLMRKEVFPYTILCSLRGEGASMKTTWERWCSSITTTLFLMNPWCNFSIPYFNILHHFFFVTFHMHLQRLYIIVFRCYHNDLVEPSALL